MNTPNNNLFTLQHKDEIKDFTAATAEHQFPDFNHAKQFTAAEMWNLQRRSRTMLQRRRNA